nr:nonstructural protein 1-1 [Porcine rotavirus B]
MGSRQSSLQSQSHRIDIQSHHSNIHLNSNALADFKTHHILVAAGSAIIALLLAFLISSLICNCYLIRRLRHGPKKLYRTGQAQERSYSSLPRQSLRSDYTV